ncbi:MAG: hypothetical protein AAF291_06725 [Pseudomonadota bacterium]
MGLPRATRWNVPSAMLDDLKQRHSEPQRRYHDWTHIEALLDHLETVQDRIEDRDAVVYAILFHDAIYDPRASDNEKRSAQLLIKSAPPILPKSRDLAKRLIEATDGHALPDDLTASNREDCAHFLDMDLGILGASEERFDIYEEQIRFGYSHVAPDDYRKGRARVLKHFAQRDQLYFTRWGQERFEAAARANLARSLAKLEGQE